MNRRPQHLHLVTVGDHVAGVSTKKPRALAMCEELTLRLMRDGSTAGRVKLETYVDGKLDRTGLA